jgi:hypothetical protein
MQETAPRAYHRVEPCSAVTACDIGRGHRAATLGADPVFHHHPRWFLTQDHSTISSDPAAYYYAPGEPLFERTTVQAFRDAGADVGSIADIVRLGVYLTTAVKCGKTGYGIASGTIKECSLLLERGVSSGRWKEEG